MKQKVVKRVRELKTENKVFPETPVAMRTIRQKEFMSIVERKGVKVIL